MARKDENTDDKKEDGTDFFGMGGTTEQAFYIMFFSGLIITIGGIYLLLIKGNTTGYSGSDETGNPGYMQTISGPSVLVFGLLLLAPPLYQRIKIKFRRKTDPE